MGRRRATVVLGPMIVRLAVATAALTAAAAGCGPDGSAERPYEPTLPAVDFRPKLVLTIGDDGKVAASVGPRTDADVRTDPPSVPSGSVIAVRNGGTANRRLRAAASPDEGAAFDTGIMRPGEETTVVVTNAGPDPQDLELVDVVADRPVGHLTVAPAPSVAS